MTAVGGEGVLIKLADGLKPEHSNSFSGSVDWTANIGHWQTNLLLEAFYTGLDDVFVLEKIGQDEQGNTVKERRNGNGARVYGVNLDGKLAHGRDVALQVGFTVQRSRIPNTRIGVRTKMWSRPSSCHVLPIIIGYFYFDQCSLQEL